MPFVKRVRKTEAIIVCSELNKASLSIIDARTKASDMFFKGLSKGFCFHIDSAYSCNEILESSKTLIKSSSSEKKYVSGSTEASEENISITSLGTSNGKLLSKRNCSNFSKLFFATVPSIIVNLNFSTSPASKRSINVPSFESRCIV